jgi:hypothetical protein
MPNDEDGLKHTDHFIMERANGFLADAARRRVCFGALFLKQLV